MQISVIIPTHNPNRTRLERTLQGLKNQTLPTTEWETIIVDNGSSSVVDLQIFSGHAPDNVRVVREPNLGLSFARKTGFKEARGQLAIMVDDDNVLAPDYLENVLIFFAQNEKAGAVGGRSFPEFERAPESWWQAEFNGLIACRDLGTATLFAQGKKEYPECAPIGAGMALRRAAFQSWLDSSTGALTDRRGGELTSGGDNDIVLTVLGAGWTVAYSPALRLTHLIPAGRVEKKYLARLNRGIAKSWMQVLYKHGVNPWAPIAPGSVFFRKLKAWFAYNAWAGPAAYIRWQGACGHFEGRASLSDNS